MSVPEPPKVMTTDNLYQKIGVLSVSNEFLSGEVDRLNAWIKAFRESLLTEVAQIESKANVEEEAIAGKIKAAIVNLKLKL